MKKLLILFATILTISTTALVGCNGDKPNISSPEPQQTVQSGYPKPKPMPRLIK